MMGEKGKTWFQKHVNVFCSLQDVVVLSGKGADMKHGVLQYKETNKRLPKLMLVNSPRSVEIQYISYAGLDKIKDMFFISPKYEGGVICGEPRHMMIFSNHDPEPDKFSTDRWARWEFEGIACTT